MKNISISSISLVFWLILAGCAEQSPGEQKKETSETEPTKVEKLRVVTTFTVIADMARNVAGNSAEVVSVTRAGAEIHNYQPTPKDIARTAGADLILWNGMGLELWFKQFLQQLDAVESRIITQGIEPIDIYQGPYSGRPNPHAWMSPTDAETYVNNISKALSEMDPANATTYASNAEKYILEIREVAGPVREQLQSIAAEDRWLVSSEGAFSYLTRDFDLKELYLWPINADQQGTPSQVRNVIDKMRENNIPVIFSESTVSAKPAQQIAQETGAHYGGLLYVDSLSEADGPVPTYLDLLRVTTDTVVQGLSTALSDN